MKLPGLEGASQDEQLTLFRNRETAALIGWAPFMHSPRLRQRLGRISVPTLVLWGESDRVVTPDYGRAFARAIPGSVFETIPAAGHYPYLEQPEEFAAVVSAFLLQDPGAAANQVCAEVAR
jgi:pimeloyl-ACP methyl ester carboxylesterase